MTTALLESPVMASEKNLEKTVQLNVLIPEKLMRELREYANETLYQPSMGKIVAQAIAEHIAAQRKVAAAKADKKR